MTIEKLREIHRASPFLPFTMRMADSTSLRVTHPESLAYSPSGRTVICVAPDDSHHYIDLLLVVRLEIENGAVRRDSPR